MKPAIIFIPLCKTKLIRVSSSPTVEKCITNCSQKKSTREWEGVKKLCQKSRKNRYLRSWQCLKYGTLSV